MAVNVRRYRRDKQLNFTFDLTDMKKTLKDWKKFEKYIVQGFEDAKEIFGKLLVDKCKEYLIEYGLGNSDLINTISYKLTTKGVTIRVGASYSAFVEYGTGIVGATNTPHPDMGTWDYDINNHGEKGWWYPTESPYPNQPTRTINGKLYAWTKGEPSRPFMYKTYLWGIENANDIFLQSIQNSLLKSGVVK